MKESFVEQVMNDFEPLSEDEQRFVLRLYLDKFCDLTEKLNGGNYENEDAMITLMSNYVLFTSLFTKRNNNNKGKELMLKEGKDLLDGKECEKV